MNYANVGEIEITLKVPLMLVSSLTIPVMSINFCNDNTEAIEPTHLNINEIGVEKS